MAKKTGKAGKTRKKAGPAKPGKSKDDGKGGKKAGVKESKR